MKIELILIILLFSQSLKSSSKEETTESFFGLITEFSSSEFKTSSSKEKNTSNQLKNIKVSYGETKEYESTEDQTNTQEKEKKEDKEIEELRETPYSSNTTNKIINYLKTLTGEKIDKAIAKNIQPDILHALGYVSINEKVVKSSEINLF